MAGYGRGSAQVRREVNEDTRMAGQPGVGYAAPRRGRALARLRSGWRRRVGTTGVLLAVIAVTMVMAR